MAPGKNPSHARAVPQDSHIECVVTSMDLRFPRIASRGASRVLATTDPWFSETLCRVKGSVVPSTGVDSEGEWHNHCHDVQFILSLAGKFLVEFEYHQVELEPRQGCAIEKGAIHRIRPVASMNSGRGMPIRRGSHRLVVWRAASG